MGLGIQTDGLTNRRIKKCCLKHVCLQTAFFQDKAASDVSIQGLKQWFERKNACVRITHTARQLESLCGPQATLAVAPKRILLLYCEGH
ncbi:hypothetical protein DRA67_05595 [Neisseria meningitidis]|uniref:Transposase n=1 Tax=Neisseria meningitidis TaxID=487 RepID=A0AB36RSI5_NEIME|nr:hypothetical protein A6J51_09115 [Neisseria meningitidis]ATL33727.1 hypothetical protein CQR35_03445 [Neisseria meningitidis]ATL36540.1 hypothetical protein CQR34_06680 [Neisseria meningitidis]AUX06204.1 hypothetical protein BVD88_07210 [Neisseria meningitidis]MBG8595507.1 hypothetical protein [Neisseria meningitidis]